MSGTGAVCEHAPMRRFVFSALPLAVLALAVTGCSDPDLSKTAPAPAPFCEAFQRFDEKVSSGKASEADQRELLREAVRLAPDPVRADGQTFLEGYERLANGESPELVRQDEARYQAASLNFQRWGNQHCGTYARRSSI